MCAWLSTTAASARGSSGGGSPIALPQGLEPLEEAAIEQQPVTAVLDQVLRAGDSAAGGSEEGEGRRCRHGHGWAVFLLRVRPVRPGENTLARSSLSGTELPCRRHLQSIHILPIEPALHHL